MAPNSKDGCIWLGNILDTLLPNLCCYFLFFFYNIENIIEKILFRIDEDLGEGTMLREPNCTAQVTKQ